MTLERKTELKRTPFKLKAPRSSMASSPMRQTRRPSEAPFHAEVMEAYGRYCHAAGSQCEGPIQSAHIWGKGQTGPTVVENGLPLCRGHHAAYDGYRMKLRWEWLTSVQRDWLAEVGYVSWDENGETYGVGCRRFAPMTVGQVIAREEKK